MVRRSPQGLEVRHDLVTEQQQQKMHHSEMAITAHTFLCLFCAYCQQIWGSVNLYDTDLYLCFKFMLFHEHLKMVYIHGFKQFRESISFEGNVFYLAICLLLRI